MVNGIGIDDTDIAAVFGCDAAEEALARACTAGQTNDLLFGAADADKAGRLAQTVDRAFAGAVFTGTLGMDAFGLGGIKAAEDGKQAAVVGMMIPRGTERIDTPKAQLFESIFIFTTNCS